MSGEQKDSADKAPSLDELLAEVDAAVEQKKAEGLYDPDEVKRIEEMPVNFVQAVEDGAEAELALRGANLGKLWDTKEWGVTTHRAGGLARIILGLKKLLHKVSGFPLGVWFARQVQFNDELVKLTNVLVPQHTDLRHRMNHNEKRLDELEYSNRALYAELARIGDYQRLYEQLQNQIKEANRHAEARISGLERAAGSDRSQIENALAGIQATLEDLAKGGVVSADAVNVVAAERQRARGSGYLAFEDMHRGDREEIKERQEVYLPYFKDAISEDAPLLDIGCGRGEFLEAAREAGLAAKGVDLNPEMAAFCQEQGLNVVEGDAIEYLRGLPDESLGGILAAQLIEHLPLDELTEMISLCSAKLKPGGVLIAETVNPQCLTTFSGAFYLDLTHIKPIHPEAARFLWRWAGLGQVELVYLSPYPPEHRLENYTEDDDGLAGVVNRNVERLNSLLYSHQDYAVVGRK
jgi:2-polyprenyl-3-methyl-5-hydroxy-6-metoxy-1,4-benzoquinol methylase